MIHFAATRCGGSDGKGTDDPERVDADGVTATGQDGTQWPGAGADIRDRQRPAKGMSMASRMSAYGY